MMRKYVASCMLSLSVPAVAWAAESPAPTPDAAAQPPASPTGEAAAPEAPKPPPAPYSLPWMMRPLGAANVFRIDGTFAFSKPRNSIPFLLLFSKTITPNLAVILRWSTVFNFPTEGKYGGALCNPALGALYSVPISKSVKASFFAGTTIPLGLGDTVDKKQPEYRAAYLSGIFARASMDNALFQLNYMTPMVGADIGYVADGYTVQAEVTLLELIRVRRSDLDKDATRTNLTAAVHAGYFPIPQLSFGVELRYQYWIYNPTIWNGKDPTAVDNWTLGFGPRAHIKLSSAVWLRPGVSLTMGLDSPTGFGATGLEYKIVQVDVPVIF
jgi:hypothetical protein